LVGVASTIVVVPSAFLTAVLLGFFIREVGVTPPVISLMCIWVLGEHVWNSSDKVLSVASRSRFTNGDSNGVSVGVVSDMM